MQCHSNILPLQILYADKVSSAVSCLNNAPSTSVISLPKLIQNTSMRPGFLRLEIITSRLKQNQGSFSRFGAKLWNAIPNEFRKTLQRIF